MNKLIKALSDRRVRLWIAVDLFILIACLGIVFGIAPRYKQFIYYPELNTGQKINSSQVTPPQAVKILTFNEGIYTLTSQELEQAGFRLVGIHPTQLRLLNRGQDQPLWVKTDQEGFVVYFYASLSSNLYNADNIYWLVSSEERHAQELPEKGTASKKTNFTVSNTYTDTIHLEQNFHYVPQVYEGDHWMWEMLPAPKFLSFNFKLVDLAQIEGYKPSIVINLWASTEAKVNPDHHLEISINGHVVFDEIWDGKGMKLFQIPFSGTFLLEGKNTIDIRSVGDTNAPADIVYIDWINIDYPRFTKAQKDQLWFYSRGLPQQLQNFSGNVDVYDVTEPNRITFLGEFLNNQPQVVFKGVNNHRYMAVGPLGFQRADQILPVVSSPDLYQKGLGADYLVIGPNDLLEPFKPLLDWREQQGMSTLAVPVEAVFDQFGYGFHEPEAIRSFIRYADENWDKPPSYVLLIGDATYDPRGYQSPVDGNLLPTFFIQTEYGGETASDVRFTIFDNTTRPKIALGRIPARTPNQVITIVNKILTYERRAGKEKWRRKVLAVADGQDAAFTNDAKSFLENFSNDFVGTLYAPQAGVVTANQQIRKYINKGIFLLAYFGHGSIDMWGKDHLLSNEDLPSLNNLDQLPVVLNVTCLTGLFTHPKLESMAETFLWQNQGGAISVLAPTSLTLPSDQDFLSQQLAQGFAGRMEPTIGKIFLSAQRQIPLDTPGQLEVLLTFLLFGDPALRLY